MTRIYTAFFMCLYLFIATNTTAQTAKGGKKISTDLFGFFFEYINYSVEGGLYAELVQNRLFNYNPIEQNKKIAL